LAITDQDNSPITYRMTGTDLSNFANYIGTLNSQLPAGSSFRIEFPVNGGGVGNGWYFPDTESDTLFQEALQLQNTFWFLSHTYTHPDLTDYTYAETIVELANNTAFAETLFLPNSWQTLWSSTAMVNPSISGLFNGQVLQAMWNSGIRYAVGDNSIADESPVFPYWGWYTTTAVDGFAGMFILPRAPTDIFYYSVDDTTEAGFFNAYYPQLGGQWTLAEIMSLEANVTVGNLLTFRHDPYMFHQNNIKTFTYNGQSTSLLQIWLTTVSSLLLQYTNLPIITYREQDLGALYQQRMQRDSCNLTATVAISNSQITNISLKGVASCTAAVTGLPLGTCSSPTCTTEEYGPDTTTYIPLTANTAVSFALSTKLNLY